MWTAESRALVGDFGAGQALSDEQYALLAPLIPPAKPGGRPRTTDMRRLLDGLFYLVRTGCQWRHLPPPPAFPPWRTVYEYMRAFRERRRLGDDPPPPRDDAARAGRPRVEPGRGHRRHPERENDRKRGPRGYDAAKRVKGRKRHVAVDTSGLLLGVLVHAADIQDADGAGDLLRRLKRLYPWLKVVFADSVYDRLAALLACFLLGLTLVVIRRLAGTEGFAVVPRRWVAERTLGWLGRWRRLAKDYEELPEVSETMVKLAMIRLMLHRLAHPNRKRLSAP
jgi:putative transposase